MDNRQIQLHEWLKRELPDKDISLNIASADASFRRYFRVHIKGELEDRVLICMDAPPAKENCRPFLNYAKRLSDLNVHTPKVYKQNIEQGFILLEDLGQSDYLTSLQSGAHPDALYADAISALVKIQRGDPKLAQSYDQAKLLEEMSLFKDWFLARHLGRAMNNNDVKAWDRLQQRLCDACLAQPQVWVHRDFHSRNLMVTESENPGVIDFQDLVTGPISYDLASIFKDCYIEWPRERQLGWLNLYYRELNTNSFSFTQLVEWYDLTGFQRHLKVLGIFCRLNYRDGKQHYLNDLPLVAKYCLEVMDLYRKTIPEISEFCRLFKPIIQITAEQQ